MSDEVLGWDAGLDQPRGRGSLHDRPFAGPARVFRPARDDDFELGGRHVQPLGTVLAHECMAPPQQGQAVLSGSMTISSRGRWAGSAPRLTERGFFGDACSVALRSPLRRPFRRSPARSPPWRGSADRDRAFRICGRTAPAAADAASPKAAYWRPARGPVRRPSPPLVPPSAAPALSRRRRRRQARPKPRSWPDSIMICREYARKNRKMSGLLHCLRRRFSHAPNLRPVEPFEQRGHLSRGQTHRPVLDPRPAELARRGAVCKSRSAPSRPRSKS